VSNRQTEGVSAGDNAQKSEGRVIQGAAIHGEYGRMSLCSPPGQEAHAQVAASLRITDAVAGKSTANTWGSGGILDRR
jgi:hypothetical protein